MPPVLPAIHRDLGLNEKLVGALSGLPVLLLSVAAVSGSLLVARLGARRALVLGLCLVAAAGAARGIGPSTPVLFVMTFFMGAGIAVSQPTLPSLVRQWFPGRTALATAVYSNGFLIGEIAAAALTGLFILALVGGSWELALPVWSIPVLATAIAVLLFTPHTTPEEGAAPVRWWPDWQSSRTWRLGLILGGASVAYFGTNAFLPDYLKATHHAELITAALTSINLCQLPSSILTALAPDRLVGRRWPLMLAGTLVVVAAAGFRMGGIWVVAWAGLLGFGTALVFVLTLALPPLLAEAGDVHRLSAAIFTLTYACPFPASLLGGAIWDATGIPATTFVPVAAAGLAMILLTRRLDLSAAVDRAAEPPPGDSTGDGAVAAW